MSARVVNLPWSHLATTSASDIFLPATGWMSTQGVVSFRETFELVNFTGTGDVAVGYQIADTIDDPIASGAIGASKSSNGFYFATGITKPDTSPDVRTRQLVRFGFIVSAEGSLDVRAAGTVQIVSE